MRYNSDLVRPIRCEFEGIKFDSKLEGQTYLLIRNYLPQEKVVCQYKVLRSPKSKNYPRREWKCDFFLPSIDLHIEVKGIADREFKELLRDLDLHNPDVFNRLIVVGSYGYRIDSVRNCVSLTTFNGWMSKRLNHVIKPIPYV